MAKKDNIDQQLELFAPAFPSSIAVKDQQDLLQYPFFSLSRRKRTTPIEYDDGKVKLEVFAPEKTGIASIYDEEILIYVASQLIEAQNKGLPTSPEVKVSRYDILKFLGKATDGKSYKWLTNALERLQATSVHTTIRNDKGYKRRDAFSWIESWSAVEKNGKPIAIRFRLSEWLYKGIVEETLILTLDREYFRIDGGLERFLYRLCRKVVGKTPRGLLEMKLETVHRRSGTTQKLSRFRKIIGEIMDKQSVPHYWILVINNAKKQPVVLAIARQPGENISTGFERAMKEWKTTQRLRTLRKTKNPRGLLGV